MRRKSSPARVVTVALAEAGSVDMRDRKGVGLAVLSSLGAFVAE